MAEGPWRSGSVGGKNEVARRAQAACIYGRLGGQKVRAQCVNRWWQVARPSPPVVAQSFFDVLTGLFSPTSHRLAWCSCWCAQEMTEACSARGSFPRLSSARVFTCEDMFAGAGVHQRHQRCLQTCKTGADRAAPDGHDLCPLDPIPGCCH